MAITEVEPLLAYVRSTRANAVLDLERLDRLRQAISSAIARDGAWHVTKEAGLFCCVA